jgi:DNA-binding XRE family transcriptional regulator
MAVYFMRESGAGHIKIGFTNHIHRRLDQVKVYSAHEITLLGAEPGDEAHEARLHQRFAADRVRGEWFAASPALLAYIEQLPPVAKPKRKNSSEWGDTGLTDDIVAARIGIGRPQVGRIRRGICQPSLPTAIKLSELTGRPVESFLSKREAA